MTILQQIKRVIFSGRVEFTHKASLELEMDDLIEQDVIESLVYAHRINKTLRSTSLNRSGRERLHIIISRNLAGVPIYSKGKLVESLAGERYYLLISAKRAD